MELTKAQYKKLGELMMIARKPAKISNYKFIIENSCKWREISKEYGKWHTVYIKFGKYSKKRYNCQSYRFFSLKSYFSSDKKTKIV